jgi:hypothetical protein
MKLGPRPAGDYLVAALTEADYENLVSERARRLEALAALATRITLVEGDHRTIDIQLIALPRGAR